METALFDYTLPEELIARHPAGERTHSRLFIVERKTGNFIHSQFFNISQYLKTGDLLVFNNTRVIPARLMGYRFPGGGKVETLLLKEVEPLLWKAMVRPAKKVQIGERLIYEPKILEGEVIQYLGPGERLIKFECRGIWQDVLNKIGHTPLPPYIIKARRDDLKTDLGHTPLEEAGDRERYQTVYAQHRGSVAAPTAGFHFSSELISTLEQQGVVTAYLTLHIGAGTFKPVETERVEDHPMHSETYMLPKEAAEKINRARREGRRIIPVGTTAVRTLESCADEMGFVHPDAGETNLMILPGYKFKCADAMLTNFHLPRSTLLMLVCAFGGTELLLNAYSEAISKGYRFYSYGDAMLIL